VRWSESRAILPYGRNHKATKWRGAASPRLPLYRRSESASHIGAPSGLTPDGHVPLSDTAGGASGPSSLVALLQDYAVTGSAVDTTASPTGLARLKHPPRRTRKAFRDKTLTRALEKCPKMA
jgi:hypothetical protein